MGAEQPEISKSKAGNERYLFRNGLFTPANKIYRGNEILFDERISAKGKMSLCLEEVIPVQIVSELPFAREPEK